MKTPIPSIVTDGPCRDPGLSVNIAGPLCSGSGYSAIRNSISPTTKSHFKRLPASVIAVNATDSAEVAPYLENTNVLVVDIRPFNLYSASRLQNAHNVCVPTTLLKRSSYDLVHIVNSSSMPQEQKTKVLGHSTPMSVLVYDSALAEDQVSFPLYQTISKFLQYDCFTVSFLNGGFSHVNRLLIDTSTVLPLRTPISPVTPQSAKFSDWSMSETLLSPGVSVDSMPFLSGFALPSATTSNQKLLLSIKKNLPKLDTTASFIHNFRLPERFAEKRDRLPKWLAFLADNYGQANYNAEIVAALSDKFNRLEKSEQVRLSMAISNSNKEEQRSLPRLANEFCSPLALCPCCDKIQYTIPKGIEYGYKNRYHNIWPYEHSRVKLISSPSCATPRKDDDYFNANYINFDRISLTKYIATQNPLDSTNEDFWNTVWYNGVRGIVCLNNPLVMTPRTYYLDDQYFEKCALKIEIKSAEQHEGYKVREISVSKHDVTRTVFHFAYTEWPDFGTPDDFSSVIEMIQAKDDHMNKLPQPATTTIPQAWDLLVHCSAGCGRTGCFITLDMVIDCFNHNSKNTFDAWGSDDLVYKSVQFQRQQRISMVQNLGQFIYCYESILSYVVDKLLV